MNRSSKGEKTNKQNTSRHDRSHFDSRSGGGTKNILLLSMQRTSKLTSDDKSPGKRQTVASFHLRPFGHGGLVEKFQLVCIMFRK